MNKIDELVALKAKVAKLEGEISGTVEVITAEINKLFNLLTETVKAAGLKDVAVTIAGNKIVYDGYSWTPDYESEWYSSSSDC